MTTDQLGVSLAGLAIVVTIVIAIAQTRSRRRTNEDWATRAAEAIGHTRAVLRDCNPLQLVVGFSKTETPKYVEEQIAIANAAEKELEVVKAGHPKRELRDAAERLRDGLRSSMGATAIYVRAVASDHETDSREERAISLHKRAGELADSMALALGRE